MPELSIEKMQEIRKSKGYTYADLAKITGIPASTISKIFAGIQDNPTLSSLKKIAKALECGVDDFIEYEVEPVSPYYLDRQTGKLAQEIHDNPDLRILLDASKNLKPEDLNAVIDIANRLKGTYRQ